MPPISPEDDASIRPHALALQLIERLRRDARRGPVLDFAAGSGRNSRAIGAAGFDVVSMPDPQAYGDTPFDGIDERFAAAISTHGFLHGNRATIQRRLQVVAQRLDRGGLLYATFGSTNDARFGRGTRIDDVTFAPEDGDERGVPHTYYDRTDLERALATEFATESLVECGVDEVAGSWAHREHPLSKAVHWFVIAVKSNYEALTIDQVDGSSRASSPLRRSVRE